MKSTNTENEIERVKELLKDSKLSGFQRNYLEAYLEDLERK